MLYLKITWNQFNFFPQYPILFIFFPTLFFSTCSSHPFAFLPFSLHSLFPAHSTYLYFSFFFVFCFVLFFCFFNASLITSPPSNCPPFLLPWVSLTVWVWSGDVGMQDGDCGLGIWSCGGGADVWWLWYFLASGWYFMAVCSIFERQALWWWWDRVCVSWGLGGESVLWMLLWWDG